MSRQCREDHHHHGGHDHDHSHDHSHDAEDPEGQSLWRYVNHDHIRTLNERVVGSGKNCFKPYHQKREEEPFLESNDDDPELIIYVPFTEAVKVKSICISGGGEGKHPKVAKLFVNREDVDFSHAEDLVPTQTLELTEDFNSEIDYPLKLAKFHNVTSVTIYIPENYGADSTKVHYIGFKGDGLQFRHGIVEAVYEARPQAADHQTGTETHNFDLI